MDFIKRVGVFFGIIGFSLLVSDRAYSNATESFTYDAYGVPIGSTTAGGKTGLYVNVLSGAGQSTDQTPATQNITVADTNTTTTAGANGQNFMTGTPTAGSTALFTFGSLETVELMVTGFTGGPLVTEVSMDGGTTWFTRGIKQTGSSYLGSSFLLPFEGTMNFSGMTNVRVRATGAVAGTAVVRAIISGNVGSLIISNPLSLRDSTTQSTQMTIKPGSSTVLATDPAIVVGISPNNTIPVLAPVNANSALSARQTVTGSETSLVSPANTVGVIFECESVNADNLRWGFSNSAVAILTTTLGILCEPGRSVDYAPFSAGNYIHMISTGGGSDFMDINWVLSK